MSKLLMLTILGILAFVANIVCGLRKTFVSSWNLGNSNNWREKVTPCPGRKLSFHGLFPDSQVYLDEDIATSSVLFHQDTEVIFGESSLVLASERDDSCKGNQAESVFENKNPGYWWDPDSWQCDSSDVLNCNSAVPDLHKVPCLQDTVHIPNETDSLYRMIFTNPTPTVTVLTKGKQNMTTSEFYEFSFSEEGRQRIRVEVSNVEDANRSPLYIESEGPCTDITGCQCHSNLPFNEICRHQSRKCPQPNCENPIMMKGFCCVMCGVDIAISHNGSLAVSVVQSVLKRVLDSDGQNVDAYVGKMDDEAFMHVYFLPKDKTASFQNAVDTFKILFDREFNSHDEHSVTLAIAQGLFGLRNGGFSSTKVVLIILFLCLAIGVIGYIYRKRRLNELPFTFRRMSSGARISMRSRNTSIPSSIHIVAVETPEGRSFVNPTFMSNPEIALQAPETPSPQGVHRLDLPDITGISKPQHERENLLYEIQKDTPMSFNALKEMNNESAAIANQTLNNRNITEMQHLEEDDLKKEQINSETVMEELIVDVSVSDNEDTFSTDDDETDPLEQLAKSRVANFVKLEEKRDESNSKTEQEPLGQTEKINKEAISSLPTEVDQEAGI